MKVNLFQHALEHGTPDAVFPNNWFSTHPAGEAAGGTQQSTLVFYPMKCPNRCLLLVQPALGVCLSENAGRRVAAPSLLLCLYRISNCKAAPYVVEHVLNCSA